MNNTVIVTGPALFNLLFCDVGLVTWPSQFVLCSLSQIILFKQITFLGLSTDAFLYLVPASEPGRDSDNTDNHDHLVTIIVRQNVHTLV